MKSKSAVVLYIKIEINYFLRTTRNLLEISNIATRLVPCDRSVKK